jgi:hypothetical protein
LLRKAQLCCGDLYGQVAAELGRHDTLQRLEDRRRRAAVVLKGFRAIFDPNARLGA